MQIVIFIFNVVLAFTFLYKRGDLVDQVPVFYLTLNNSLSDAYIDLFPT